MHEQIRRIETGDRVSSGVLPFGVAEIDERLPGGGLALGALHEIAGGANGALDGAAAALFAAGVLARTHGQILWCVSRGDLFAPAIAQAGPRTGLVISQLTNATSDLSHSSERCRQFPPYYGGTLGERSLLGIVVASMTEFNSTFFGGVDLVPGRSSVRRSTYLSTGKRCITNTR